MSVRVTVSISGLALVGCGGGPPTSEVLLFGSLGNAIRDTGHVCEDVELADEIEATENDWRVTCDETLVYLVSLQSDGSVCVSPVLQGVPTGRAPAPAEPRCTTAAPP